LWRNIIPYLLPYGRCLASDYVDKNVILVVHDWGSALGFYWAQCHPERVKAIVYMEGIVRPFFSWDEWPEVTRAFFKAQRTPQGEDLILQKNLFIEYLLPLRHISHEAMEVYRRHYRNPGPTRQPC
jgi:haloalkane dehalogenase